MSTTAPGLAMMLKADFFFSHDDEGESYHTDVVKSLLGVIVLSGRLVTGKIVLRKCPTSDKAISCTRHHNWEMKSR